VATANRNQGMIDAFNMSLDEYARAYKESDKDRPREEDPIKRLRPRPRHLPNDLIARVPDDFWAYTVVTKYFEEKQNIENLAEKIVNLMLRRENDAEYLQKCREAFYQRRDEAKARVNEALDAWYHSGKAN